MRVAGHHHATAAPPFAFARAAAPKALALAVILVAALAVRPPALPAGELADLAGRYQFDVAPLPEPGGLPVRNHGIRPVNPSLANISGWISSVGASAALGDVSGDGLPNDLCHVDPAYDVAVLYSLAEPPAYDPLPLVVTALPFDHDTTAPMGCLIADLTADGRAELLVYFWGRSPVAFGLGEGGGPGAGGLLEHDLVSPPEVWNTNAVTVADVDGSGMPDVVVGNYFPDGARLLDVGAADDPLLQMQDSMSRAFNGGRSRVLLNGTVPGGSGGLRFQDVRDAFPGRYATGWTLAVGAGDLDGDMLPEIYLANDFGPDGLFHNRSEPGRVELVPVEGRRRFRTPASKVLGRGSFKGMAIDIADVTGNGYFDLFVSNIATDFGLHESHLLFVHDGRDDALAGGSAPYKDLSEPLGVARSGWGWDAKFADFDNSGRLELVQSTGFLRGSRNDWPKVQELAIGNDTLIRMAAVWPTLDGDSDLSGNEPNAFYAQGPDGRFYDVAARVGLGAGYVTRGVATGDVDGDGLVDFVLANQWEPSLLVRNRCTDCGRFLGLDLLVPLGGDEVRTTVEPGRRAGTVAGRVAIGATVLVTTADGERGFLVDAGNGHAGQREPGVHVGLGGSEVVDVTVSYRDHAGVARTVRLDVDEGWHTVLLGTDGDMLR